MEQLNFDFEGIELNLFNEEERRHVIISDNEPYRLSGTSDVEYIRSINARYINRYGVAIPYHYIITPSNTYSIKPDFIQNVSDDLTGHEHDVSIFVEGNLKIMSVSQMNALSALYVFICKRYPYLDAESMLLLPYETLNDTSILTTKNLLITNAQDALEDANSINILKHSLIREQKETGGASAKVQFTTMSRSLTSKEISEMTGVPVEVLEQENQRLTD